MNMIHATKERLHEEIEKIARKNIINKLTKQGLNYRDLKTTEFSELVADEIAILEHDSKRVAAGIGIGLILAVMTGGL